MKFHKPLKTLLIVLLPVVLLVIIKWWYWAYNPRVDELERQARRLSGWWAIDCGHPKIGDCREDHGPADACAMAAFKARKAFRVRYEVCGTDTNWYEAIVGTTQGSLYFLSYHTDCCGGPTSVVQQQECSKVSMAERNGEQRLTCD